MSKLFFRICVWLQQNHDLSLLATLAVACIAHSFFPVSGVLIGLSLAVVLISFGVVVAKLSSQNSIRVPATSKIWMGLMGMALGSLGVALAAPGFAQWALGFTCIFAVLASFYDRQCRYSMARFRIQKRRIQQSKWRASKKQVLQEWKDRLRWLAGVQHDLRQPLHAMGLLIRHPDLSKTPAATAVLSRIDSCNTWLKELAENTLEATRFELNEQRTTEISTVSSVELCHGIEGWLSHLAESKGLEFESHVQDHVIRTDVRRLKRVLGNLLFNAVEHSFDGRVSLDYVLENSLHRFTVQDNGPGVSDSVINPPADLGHFGSDLPKAGIGLYVVRKVCLEMGWKLTASNNPDSGSTFVLQFADRLASCSIAGALVAKEEVENPERVAT